MTAAVFDPTPCVLGEGALWHPDSQSLIWFDILGRRMFQRGETGAVRRFEFDQYVSAAGRVSEHTVILASQNALNLLDLRTGAHEVLVPLDAENPLTRSNDGRADPQGGFWIGTMAIAVAPGAGAIWRYHKGELRKLFPNITIPNSICFAPDGGHAYFSDTARAIIWKVRLDAQGWPMAEPEVFADLRGEGLNPDGAVVDVEGALWSAQWGASRVARYDAAGTFIDAVTFPATQISCPAFGGAGLTTLFATSAAEGLVDPAALEGAVFAAADVGKGQEEHSVLI
ncbi:SMP-30/gluconolactonase/LRE family protein (plasmid) [Falsirhodobacter algicola]|uniref:SMP-30/gluconolactonase/LRE family protein n=2 Tax=Falsirhodobacter algicola TaxID=2692330 RepID=A0A8J8MVF8_9RHOB|nr:SMP-30/gluconolactonase/LRE family protein [Falsirhodobacter algicola]